MHVNKSISKWWYFLVAVSCFHLFFINIKDSHDWGDDFAQYIHQAENITKGIPQTSTGYIYNDDYPVYSPPVYFSGFPLLLAPVYVIAGNNILAFSYLIATFLFLSLFLFFRFFNSYFNPVTSYFLVLVIVCNPWVLNFKTEIGSDIPFTFFLFLSILFYLGSKKSTGLYILLGVVAGFLISIRSIGTAFVLAVILNEMLIIKKESNNKNRKQLMFGTFLFVLVCGSFFFLLNQIVFNIPILNVQSSASLFTFKNLYKTILRNIDYYFDVFQSLFNTHPENIYSLFSTLIKSIALSLLLLGFYLRIKRGIEFIDLLLITYMMVLYTYPYSAAGYRFLIPVTPIFLLYITEGLYFLMISLTLKKNILYILGVLSFFAIYKYEWETILDNQNWVMPGPQRMDSKITFEYIKSNTEKNAIILFKKPRALALYTNRNSFVNNPDVSAEHLKNQLKENKIDYILIKEDISDRAIKDFALSNTEEIKFVWSNGNYKFYKVLKNTF